MRFEFCEDSFKQWHEDMYIHVCTLYLSNTVECHVHLLPQIMFHFSSQLLLLLTQITQRFLQGQTNTCTYSQQRNLFTIYMYMYMITQCCLQVPTNTNMYMYIINKEFTHVYVHDVELV